MYRFESHLVPRIGIVERLKRRIELLVETRGSLELITMRHDFGLIVINGRAVIVRMRSTVVDFSPIHFRGWFIATAR